ncbi:Helix-turn-helix domain-containing protein [Pseudomonas flavescens]|uniref:Helix-turn-helix domain-containing protein n=1 Tax=Phytopseudomonas flavescens TaxID=29435 RepID=A0A1G8IRK2_9GAMM|nr:helix-turn-helix domain-containing protein [Pseudomonas flavescens]SDI21628.1 Helix-turn-helix domain-containing protein [Pseudomonas flavescens]
MTIIYDTRSVAPAERLAYWQEVVCDTFVQLDCVTGDPGQFEGRLLAGSVADLDLVAVSGSPQQVLRTPQRIARSEREFVLLSLAHEGRFMVHQDGREGHLEAGGLAIYDTRSPYELHFDGAFRQTVVRIPREALQRRLDRLEYLTALPLSRHDPLARLAFDFLSGLGELQALDHTRQSLLAEQGLDLLAMALAERGRDQVPGQVRQTALLFRVKAHIQARLASPDLSLTEVAQQFGVSTRYINSLFQAEGSSFGRHVLGMRLQRCARDLRSPQLAAKRVNDIAYRWGFNDSSHFCRVFRERFGMTARAYREYAQSSTERENA